MPLVDTEVNVQIMNLLQDQWDSSAIDQSFDADAWISTGWWDEETPNPQVTLTVYSEPTDPDGMASDGSGLTSWVDGVVHCNVWVPYRRDEMASQGAAKQMRWQLTRQIHGIIEDNQRGVNSLSRLDTGELRRDPSEEPPPFRMLIPIGFQYYTSPD